MTKEPTPSAHFCKHHRSGGITSSTVSMKPCVVCGAVPTKAGREKGNQALDALPPVTMTEPTTPTAEIKALDMLREAMQGFNQIRSELSDYEDAGTVWNVLKRKQDRAKEYAFRIKQFLISTQ